MSYCVSADIQSAITAASVKQLTDDAGVDAIDETKVTAAISSADELINGFLRAGGYTLPLASTPPMLKDVSVDISVYKLYDRRFSANMPESIAKKYEHALKLLEKIQKRLILIGADDVAETRPASGGYKTNKTADDRMFPKSELDKY